VPARSSASVPSLLSAFAAAVSARAKLPARPGTGFNRLWLNRLWLSRLWLSGLWLLQAAFSAAKGPLTCGLSSSAPLPLQLEPSGVQLKPSGVQLELSAVQLKPRARPSPAMSKLQQHSSLLLSMLTTQLLLPLSLKACACSSTTQARPLPASSYTTAATSTPGDRAAVHIAGDITATPPGDRAATSKRGDRE
jgi:hypothetical protein